MIRLHMLDTNMVSYILNGKSPAARARLAAMGGSEIACISAITEAEIRYGLAKFGVGDQRKSLVDRFLLRLRIEPWGRDAAATYGILRAKQEAMGKSLGPFDTQIAAHSIALGAVLVSNDKAFLQVPDIPVVENWATDV